MSFITVLIISYMQTLIGNIITIIITINNNHLQLYRSMLLALQSRYQKLATGTIAENEHLGMEFLWVNGISSITTLTDFLMTMGITIIKYTLY